MIDYGNGIYAVDSGYEGTAIAAVYIVVDDGRAAIVDTAHNASLEPVREALGRLGVPPKNVDYILLTHVHLDHAGGTGRFMRAFPNARLIVHERGARHMAAPEKLIAGVRQVYGDEETERMYGKILPVPEERILVAKDEQELKLGKHTLVALDTPGHAKHHLAFLDHTAGIIFSGDAFGMTYHGLGEGDRQGIIPTTSPVQLDPAAMYRSMDRIVALHPQALYLTHFGEIRDIPQAERDLHRQIDAYLDLAARERGDFEKIRAGIQRIFEEEAEIQGWPLERAQIGRLFGTPITLNAQGVKVWYDKEREGQEAQNI